MMHGPINIKNLYGLYSSPALKYHSGFFNWFGKREKIMVVVLPSYNKKSTIHYNNNIYYCPLYSRQKVSAFKTSHHQIISISRACSAIY